MSRCYSWRHWIPLSVRVALSIAKEGGFYNAKRFESSHSTAVRGWAPHCFWAHLDVSDSFRFDYRNIELDTQRFPGRFILCVLILLKSLKVNVRSY